MSRQGRPIYLDYQATTPLAPEALRAMRPYLEELFGNPHSPHLYGREADAAVETARAQVASVIDVASERRFFTSGATESVNWALPGAIGAPGDRRRAVEGTRVSARVDPGGPSSLHKKKD